MPPKDSVRRAVTGLGPDGRVIQPAVGNKPVPSSARFSFSLAKAFTVFAAFNTLAALLSPIQDCDETYNYWEPAHYLLHGYGRQTWEYSPEFAIRDWLYVALHAGVAGIGGLIVKSVLFPVPVSLKLLIASSVHEIFYGGKLAEFYALRIALGLLAAGCQARFLTAVQRTLNPRVAVLTGGVMVTSPGFFIATPAFLPSSFAMCMGMLGAAAFMDWKMGMGGGAMSHGSNAGIMWFGAGAVLGWPFAGALILPFVAEELLVAVIADDKLELARRWVDGTVRVSMLIALQLGVNVFFYHDFHIVPLNIVLYNVFSGEGRGPEIFGTEPADFYIKNLALNFNVWLVLAVLSAPVLLVRWLSSEQGQSKYLLMRSLFFVAPFYMWLAIFSAQAHKEERFMYPAYPFLALNAAVALHSILAFVGNPDRKTLMGKIPPQLKFFVVSLAVIGAVDLGVSRIIGTVTGYRAPLKVYGALHEVNADPIDEVCFGKEWYRFPTSFFLPNGVHAKFVRSRFDGLLPGEFSEAKTGFGFFPGTWLLPAGMNDRNEFDPGKLTDIRRCTYFVDSHSPLDGRTEIEAEKTTTELETELEPNYAALPEWQEVQCARFLDTASTATVPRLLWLPDAPFVPARFKRGWNHFCLLRRNRT